MRIKGSGFKSANPGLLPAAAALGSQIGYLPVGGSSIYSISADGRHIDGLKTDLDWDVKAIILQPGERGFAIQPVLIGTPKATRTGIFHLYLLRAVLKKVSETFDAPDASNVAGFIFDPVATGTVVFDSATDLVASGLASVFNESTSLVYQLPSHATLTLTTNATTPKGAGSARFTALGKTPVVLGGGAASGMAATLFFPEVGDDVCGFFFETSDDNGGLGGDYSLSALWAPLREGGVV